MKGARHLEPANEIKHKSNQEAWFVVAHPPHAAAPAPAPYPSRAPGANDPQSPGAASYRSITPLPGHVTKAEEQEPPWCPARER